MQELQTHQIELEMQNEELKQAFLDLEESFELYNYAPVGYFTLNENGIITLTNITASNLFGFPKAEVLNSPFTKYIFGEDQDIYYFNHKNLIETKCKLEFEIRLLKRDKSFFWAHVDAVLSERKESDVLITITDISKLKKDEDEKQNALVLLEATLESIQNGILAVGNNGIIIKTNKEFDKMWQVPKDIIESGDDSKLLNYVLEQLSDPDKFIKKVKVLYANPKTESFDLIYFKDGRIYERISKPMHIDGNAIGRVWSFFDITNRKHAEEEIKFKNEQLEKLNAEKDKFFSIIAHDLRSPFNVFLGFTEMLKEDIHGLSLKELQTIANSMNRSANNLFELLTNLLDWSMMQRNDYAFHPVKLSLNKIINESTNLFVEAAEKKEIKMESDIADDVFINGDESMLKTILRNLISNALKFTNKGGQVSITAHISDNIASISVKDTGIGMSESIINDLYKIDVRVSRKGTDNEPSTGLGLLLCKEFIEKHNGKMWLVSEEGKGSEFTVSLPLI